MRDKGPYRELVQVVDRKRRLVGTVYEGDNLEAARAAQKAADNTLHYLKGLEHLALICPVEVVRQRLLERGIAEGLYGPDYLTRVLDA